ncbi:MAG: lactonase family protein [Trueperaceae bacterium]|nr:MAG: lactonase family protein [Trueperaceae bacterium]
MKRYESEAVTVYIGTYTSQLLHVDGKSRGIHTCRFDSSTGELISVEVTPGIVNPSYLTLDPECRTLYATQETDYAQDPALFAYRVDPASHGLQYLNHQPAHGSLPCHVATDQTGRFVVVANYGSGSVPVYPVLEDGSLGPASQILQHQGSSVDRERQEGPHAHAAVFDQENRYVFVADLGLDKVMVYAFDPEKGALSPHDPPSAPLHPGAGPRHLAFHPSGRFCFVINELDTTLTLFAYDRGVFTSLQTLSTLPPGSYPGSSCAAIRVSPSGRFVYGSNRGHDSVAIFSFDEATASLAPVGHEPTLGQTPRDFAIDPTGTFLLAANQDSDTVVTFRIDENTGRLQPTGHVAEVPSPVCLTFFP